MAIVKGALSFLGLDELHAIIWAAVFLAIVSIWCWGALGRADRDAMLAWGTATCAAAGEPLKPATGKRGEACQARVLELAGEEHDNAVQTARILAQARRDHDARSVADAAARTAGNATISEAAANMETVNAKVAQDDHVGGDWFAALNRAGGLRAPAR